MITHLKGKLIEKNHSFIIIDCQGIGFYIFISAYTYSFLSKKEGKYILIYTYFFVRENQQVLYGFVDKKERQIFSYLISVNGIGPSLSILLLSNLNPNEIEESICMENVNLISKIKGIGIKKAKKIILELKDKISKKLEIKKQSINNQIIIREQDTIHALKVLGFSNKTCKDIVHNIIKKNPDSSVEDLVKIFLEKK